MPILMHYPWTSPAAINYDSCSLHYFYPLQNELESRQKKGLVDRSTLVLAIEDPARDVGSGGATLNALYITAEHLGTRQVRELCNLSLVFRWKALLDDMIWVNVMCFCF